MAFYWESAQHRHYVNQPFFFFPLLLLFAIFTLLACSILFFANILVESTVQQSGSIASGLTG